MTTRTILLSDDIHIHRRNFASLFRYFDSSDCRTVTHTGDRELKQAFGDYARFRPRLEPHRRPLENLDADQLYERQSTFKTTPIQLWKICSSEALCFSLATRDHWHQNPVPAGSPDVFQRLYDSDRDILLDNLAAAAFWLEEMGRFLDSPSPAASHAIIFSGSMIYTRALMELCRFYRTRSLVVESTFTGHEFYLEERYSPIANRSDIRHRTVRSAIALPDHLVERHRAVAKALQRIDLAENKNVEQPTHADLPEFSDPKRPTLLIIGQVVNDFSIIEQRQGWLSTIAFYRELVTRCLNETDFNVIFKGHPWEHKKIHVRAPKTKLALEQFRTKLPPHLRDRFALRENDNLMILGRATDRVALLSSQAGLELALHCGMRPSTFGTPFFGHAGFSDDFSSIDDFITHVHSTGHSAHLTLAQLDKLHEFLTKYLQYHCVTDRPSGVASIRRRIEGRAEIRPPRTRDAASDKPQPPAAVLEVARRKLRKLQRDPRSFFRDAKIVRAIRSIG
ncbi:MAG: hypothetical protein KF901_15290 [Myxococcales bacterium]|nr:hypothetical protein [Myxococcales bacterium]